MAKTNPLNFKKLLILGLLIRVFLVLISDWHPDLPNHIDWGLRFFSYGPHDFYENSVWGVSWPNQPLGSMLLFAFIAVLKNCLFNFVLYLNNTFSVFPSFIVPVLESNLHAWLVKLPFILADIVLAYLIFKIVHSISPRKSVLAASVFLFNPVLIYNSAVWGQTDSLINLLAILGIYLTFKKKYFWGIITFFVGFLFKMSLIIYLPIFGLLLLKNIKDWKKFIFPSLVLIFIIFSLALPFTFGGKNSFEWIWYMYTNRVLPRQGSMLNGNAFNFWSLLFGINLSNSEFSRFWGLTYQLWGRLLYLVFLIPIWFKFFKSKLSLPTLFNALALSAFGCFIFLTNMHERYLYPIFPLLSVLFVLPKSIVKFKPIVLLSLIHFLNLYNLWFYPHLPFLKIFLTSFDSVACRFMSFILIVICFDYWLKYLKNENSKK